MASAPLPRRRIDDQLLRPGRALDSYATVSIVKQGRRIVAFEAKAWQSDPDKPIASTFGHFMLRATPR
jgi:acyl-coenzyme A thioesterase PaaI-like protein